MGSWGPEFLSRKTLAHRTRHRTGQTDTLGSSKSKSAGQRLICPVKDRLAGQFCFVYARHHLRDGFDCTRRKWDAHIFRSRVLIQENLPTRNHALSSRLLAILCTELFPLPQSREDELFRLGSGARGELVGIDVLS